MIQAKESFSMNKMQFSALLSVLVLGFGSVAAVIIWARPISEDEKEARKQRARDKSITREFRDFMSGKKRWSEISQELYGELGNDELLGHDSVPVYESLVTMMELGFYLNQFAEAHDGTYPESEDELLQFYPDATKISIKNFLIDSWGQSIRWWIKPEDLDEPWSNSYIACTNKEGKSGRDLYLVGFPCPQKKALVWMPPLPSYTVDCKGGGMALPRDLYLKFEQFRKEEEEEEDARAQAAR